MANPTFPQTDGLKVNPHDTAFLQDLYHQILTKTPDVEEISFSQTQMGHLTGFTVLSKTPVTKAVTAKMMREISDLCGCRSEQLLTANIVYRIQAPNHGEIYSVQFKSKEGRGMDLLMASMGETYPGRRVTDEHLPWYIRG